MNPMKKHLLSFLVWWTSAAMASAQQDISLNDSWRFWIPEGEPTEVKVPHTYNVMPGLEDYAGKASYSRSLPITPAMQGKTLRVHFGAVYHDAVVYVNGHRVGAHLHAGYTPFSFDITPYVDFTEGADNELLVECDNSYSEENLPWLRKFDWANDGGIYREVTLHVSGRQTLRYVHVTPKIQLADSTAQAQFRIRLWQPAKRLSARIRIVENASRRCIYEGLHSIRRQSDSTFCCQIDCGKVQLWHFDHPQLYTFEVGVYEGGNLSDVRTERFGFRTFKIEGNRFVLNGEPVRLPGIEDMPGSNPETGMAESREQMARAVERMKALHTTITRFHWAQDDYRLQLMDSLGILVQEELSWWQGPSEGLTPSLRATARQQLTELIEAHYNHPSVFGWGMSNEVGGDNRKDLLDLAAHTHSLDTTRIVDALCNRLWMHLSEDQSLVLDLPTWNEYIGTWHAEHRDQLPGLFAQIEPVLQGRPLFITENGLCEPAFTGGDARRIDEMLYHIAEWKRHPFVCGYIYFCLEDYRTQMGEEGYGKNRIRRHGVMDKYLRPKASYSVLQQLMCPLEVIQVKPAGQKEHVGTLANLYDVDASNHSAQVTLRVKSDIPAYTLRGYRLTYVLRDGSVAEEPLPDLAPGQTFTVVLNEVNEGYNFQVVRPDSSSVIIY